MSEALNKIFTTSIDGQKQAFALMEKLVAVAQPASVYSQPVQAEGQTVITASEVSVSMGFGYGGGGGIELGRDEEQAEVEADSTGGGSGGSGGGGDGGGGGGGLSTGRPVAAIIINADGVRVEPIVDPSKISIAFFTAFGSIMLMIVKMLRK